jgi:hypothetical protein
MPGMPTVCFEIDFSKSRKKSHMSKNDVFGILPMYMEKKTQKCQKNSEKTRVFGHFWTPLDFELRHLD